MVFAVTLALLIFQVAAGLASGSLALLADTAHGLIDVISYGLNYFIERLKVRSEALGEDVSRSAVLSAKVDICGAIVSTVALLAATGWAVWEALARLRDDVGVEEEKFRNIGFILLVFAVVSTAANIGVLVMYVYWQTSSRLVERIAPLDIELASCNVEAEDVPFQPFPGVPPPPSPAGDSALSGLRFERRRLPVRAAADVLKPVPSLRPIVLDSESSDPPSADEIAAAEEQGFSSPSRRTSRQVDHKQRARPVLNLMGDYAAGSLSRRGCSDGCAGASCGERRCAPLDTSGGAAGLAAAQDGREHEPVGAARAGCSHSGCGGCASDGPLTSSILHMLVHPGCTDSSHALPGKQVESSGGNGNLNLSAAMLHLVADVFRGITILITAIIIEAGIVSDAGKVDAICALLVAAFILIGAFAIFQRLASSMKQMRCCASCIKIWQRRY
jgi:Co/Zn/Cd efflux system component